MPNRILKESICVSDDIDRLSWFEEVVFYRLLVNCDDYGRFDGRPAILKSRLFPLKENITLKSVESAIHTLASAGLVVLYEFEGTPYLYLPTWARHQNIRAKRSRYPEPPAVDCAGSLPDNTCVHMQSDVSNSPRTRTRESESEKESDSSSEGARPRAEAAGLPDDTVLSLAHPVNLVGSESERDKYLRDVLHL